MGRNAAESWNRAVDSIFDHIFKQQHRMIEPTMVHGAMDLPRTTVPPAPEASLDRVKALCDVVLRRDGWSKFISHQKITRPALIPQTLAHSPYSNGEFVTQRRGGDWFPGDPRAKAYNLRFENRASEIARHWEQQTDRELQVWRNWRLQLSQGGGADVSFTHTPTTQPELDILPGSSGRSQGDDVTSSTAPTGETHGAISQSFSEQERSGLYDATADDEMLWTSSNAAAQSSQTTTAPAPRVLVPATQYIPQARTKHLSSDREASEYREDRAAEVEDVRNGSGSEYSGEESSSSRSSEDEGSDDAGQMMGEGKQLKIETIEAFNNVERFEADPGALSPIAESLDEEEEPQMPTEDQAEGATSASGNPYQALDNTLAAFLP
jgi:hypothetical protein